jgi:hypothetical protein
MGAFVRLAGHPQRARSRVKTAGRRTAAFFFRVLALVSAMVPTSTPAMARPPG